jgi:hypothetical protein
VKTQLSSESKNKLFPHTDIPKQLDMSLYHFDQPFSACIYGPSGCGKTFFVQQLLQSNLIRPYPTNILYISDANTTPPDIPQAAISHDLEDITHAAPHTLIIIDDLLQEGLNDSRVMDLFTRGVHHRRLSCIFLCQKLFCGGMGKYSTTIADNCNYKIIFKCPQNKQSIRTLAQRMCPTRWQHLVEMFEQVTSQPYTYMLMDMRPQCPDDLRFRTNVLGEDGGFPKVHVFENGMTV